MGDLPVALSPVLRRRLFWFAVKVALTVAVLGSYVIWHQQSGLSRLATIQDSHAAEGLGGTLGDLLAEMPETDAARQERWWAWQGKAHARVEGHNKTVKYLDLTELWRSDPDVRKWRVGLSSSPPDNMVQEHAIVADLIDELEALLDSGPFLAGAAGVLRSTAHADDTEWLIGFARDASEWSYEYQPENLLRTPNLAAIRLAVAGLGYRALVSQSPDPYCRRLNTLVTSFRNSVALIEAMICVLVITSRDETFFSLAVRGALPANTLEPWLNGTDQPALLPLVADGMRGERLLRLGAMIELAYRWQFHRYEHPYITMTGWKAWAHPPMLWWHGPEGLAVSIDAMADAERRLRQGPAHHLDVQKWVDRFQQLSGILRIVAPNLIESGITAQRCEFESRCWRVAALLVQAQRSGRALPTNVDEARVVLGPHAGLLTGGPDRLTMTYQPLTTARFRLGVDLDLSTEGDLTPLARYRKSPPATFGPPRPLRRPDSRSLRELVLKGRFTGPAPAPREDVPPKMSQQRDLEIWIPEITAR